MDVAGGHFVVVMHTGLLLFILVFSMRPMPYTLYRRRSSQGRAYAQVAVYYQQLTCCPLYSGTYPNCFGMMLMTQNDKIILSNLARCPQGCVHGTCGPPNTCTCNSGWTGSRCDTG